MIAKTDKERGKDRGKDKANEGKGQKKALRHWRSQMDL
jgi:hypothetical protein